MTQVNVEVDGRWRDVNGVLLATIR